MRTMQSQLIGQSPAPARVLLMEDEINVAKGFQLALAEEGYGVDLATTGQGALETIDRNGYDLLVADLRLPDMDGIEVIKRVKDARPDIRVIVITGYAEVASAVAALQAGASDYLAKPLTEQEFIAAVENALGDSPEAVRPSLSIGTAPESRRKLICNEDVERVLWGALLEDGPEQPANGGPKPPATPHFQQAHPELSELLVQNKMVSLGRLAASIVHEINNPLSGILNYVRMMLKSLRRNAATTPQEAEKFLRYLTLVESEVSRCAEIVSNLLAFSRKSPMEEAPVHIPDVLEKCVMLSRHKLEMENIRVALAVQSEVPTVLGDFNQIQQCVINLIFNAIDAMAKGGTLTLECSENLREDAVEILIQDNGCGIAEENMAHIFDPFFSTKEEGKGLGLGLSTVHRIITRHKGTISVESTVGQGTRFVIKLPKAKAC